MRSRKQAPQRRRSASEWTRLVAESRESGLSLVEIAASRGVPIQRLGWGGGPLGVATSLPAAPADKRRLVPVDVEPAPVPSASCSSAPAWELCTVGGDVLRVYRAVASAEIEAVLSVMLPRPGRR